LSQEGDARLTSRPVKKKKDGLPQYLGKNKVFRRGNAGSEKADDAAGREEGRKKRGTRTAVRSLPKEATLAMTKGNQDWSVIRTYVRQTEGERRAGGDSARKTQTPLLFKREGIKSSFREGGRRPEKRAAARRKKTPMRSS